MNILDKISNCGKSHYYVSQKDYDELVKAIIPCTADTNIWTRTCDLDGNLSEPGAIGMYGGVLLIDARYQ